MRRKVRCRWASLCSKPALRPRADVEREAVALVHDRIGPVANFKAALVVAGLPKTRSGTISDGEDYPMPATIDDSTVLGEIKPALHKSEYWRH
jgi:propionyl-CoA synthetase